MNGSLLIANYRVGALLSRLVAAATDKDKNKVIYCSDAIQDSISEMIEIAMDEAKVEEADIKAYIEMDEKLIKLAASDNPQALEHNL